MLVGHFAGVRAVLLGGGGGSVVLEEQLSAGISSVTTSRKSTRGTGEQREHKGRGKQHYTSRVWQRALTLSLQTMVFFSRALQAHI